MKGNLYRKIGKKAWFSKEDKKIMKKRKYKYRNYFKDLTN